ncbi:MurR/RpiR family transcriptional regulator [Soehngenia saccharolytica]|nr:MurR/RpiR family transcriptional regulator [Soehngenia saccharolytica]
MANEKGSLEKIVQIYNDLNKAEKKVAKYILENPRDIIHFSITELAESSGVSETTVFRVCNKLGYKGYQDLKINLAGEIIKPIENIHEEVKEGDDTYLIMQKILKSNINSLDNTLRLNEPEKIAEASKITLEAKQLMFFGMGGSFSLAEDAHHKFIRLGKTCSATSDSHWQAMLISLASKNDVVYAFSNSGSNKELLDNIRLAKENNLKIISITANAKSPIAKESDISLIAYGKESLFRSEAMESRVSALMIIDWIYVNSAMTSKDEALGNLEKIRKGIASKRL